MTDRFDEVAQAFLDGPTSGDYFQLAFLLRREVDVAVRAAAATAELRRLQGAWDEPLEPGSGDRFDKMAEEFFAATRPAEVGVEVKALAALLRRELMTALHRQALEDLNVVTDELRQVKAFFDGAYVDSLEIRERIRESIEATLRSLRISSRREATTPVPFIRCPTCGAIEKLP